MQVDKDNNVIEVDNEKMLDVPGEEIRFVFWDVIRYDGFIRGVDDRMGYNWRYNGLKELDDALLRKRIKPCYSATQLAEMVKII